MGERCEIWMTVIAAETAADIALLNPVETARRDGYVFAADRTRFTLGVALARRAVGAGLGIDPAEVRLTRECPRCGEPHGRPLVPGTDLHLSVSHSADIVAVALTSAGPVGLDVERIAGAQRIADPGFARAHAPGQPRREALVAGSDDMSEPDFARTWCRTEAVVKATGDGVRAPLEAVIVSRPHEQARLLSYPRQIGPMQLADLDLAPGYAAALAVLTSEPISVTVRRLPACASSVSTAGGPTSTAAAAR